MGLRVVPVVYCLCDGDWMHCLHYLHATRDCGDRQGLCACGSTTRVLLHYLHALNMHASLVRSTPLPTSFLCPAALRAAQEGTRACWSVCAALALVRVAEDHTVLLVAGDLPCSLEMLIT